MSRYFAADPTELRLSVSAVVRRASDAKEILLMRRADNGHWGLPGGYVEVGESVSEAVAREVREETGFGIDVGRLVGVYSEPARQVIEYTDGRRVQAVNLCFEAVARDRGEPTTPEETLDTGFYAPDALPEPFVPIHAVRVADAASGEPMTRIR